MSQDMVPRYMVDKSFGKSLYTSDFDGEKVHLSFVTQISKNEMIVTTIPLCYLSCTHSLLVMDSSVKISIHVGIHLHSCSVRELMYWVCVYPCVYVSQYACLTV